MALSSGGERPQFLVEKKNITYRWTHAIWKYPSATKLPTESLLN
jgi:hypothetical protein